MIVDCHCHAGTGDRLTAPWNTAAPLGAYLRRARAAGIARTVVFAPFHGDYARANAEVARIVARHPRRLIGFAFVHPERDAGRIGALVAHAATAWGFRGIKVHGADALPNREVCEAALACRLPLLVDVVGKAHVVDLLAEQYPGVNFIIPHLGSFAVDVALDRLAAASPKREGTAPRDVQPGAAAIPETSAQAAISGTALLAGAILDGIPENAAIGIGLHADGPGLGVVLLGAVFLGNLPESISSAVGMRQEGRSRRYIVGVWSLAALACTLATVAGYALLGGLSPDLRGALLALAAGAILAMLADTMMPEAFQHGGPGVALATAIGFVCAFLLSHLVS